MVGLGVSLWMIEDQRIASLSTVPPDDSPPPQARPRKVFSAGAAEQKLKTVAN